MWNIFKKYKKEFLFSYRFGMYNYNTIIVATDRQKAIKKFTDYESYNSITSIIEL